MRIQPTATTQEIVTELGDRLRGYRLQQNRTLEDVAAEAGVHLSTARRAEIGANPTLETVVRLLRALGRLDALDAFLPTPLVSPIRLAELGGRRPQRAGTPRRKHPRRDEPNG